MPTKTYSVYLTTQAAAGSIYAPIDETNLARVTWAINWTGIFNGNVNKPAKVRFVLRSLSQSGVLTWAANLGTLRAQGLSTAFISPCSVKTSASKAVTSTVIPSMAVFTFTGVVDAS